MISLRTSGAALAAALLVAGCSGSSSSPTPETPPTFEQTLQGTYAVCRNDGGMDYREVFQFDGRTFEIREYGYGTSTTTCGGDPILLAPQSGRGTFTVGPSSLVPDPAGGEAQAYELDVAAEFAGVATSIYTIASLKTGVTPNLLVFGDDSGAYPGTSDATRPVALQSIARPRVASPAAWPAIVQGAWKLCRPGTPDQTEWLVFSGSSFQVRLYDRTSSGGTCQGDSVLSEAQDLAYALGPEVVTTMGSFPAVGHALDIVDPDAPTTPIGYTLVWVDGLSAPNALYLGDDSGGKATVPEDRPTILQTWERYRTAVTQPTYPASVLGAWLSPCVTEDLGAGLSDYKARLTMSANGSYTMLRQKFTSSGGTCGTFESESTVHSGTWAITGTAPALLPAGVSTLHVTAAAITFDRTVPTPQTTYSVLYIDPYSSPLAMLLGTPTAGHEGTSSANRQEMLGTIRYKQ